MKQFLTVVTYLTLIFNLPFNTSENLTKDNVLKTGTTLTYEIFELNRAIGLGGERIKEGESKGDTVKITLVTTKKGLQPMHKDSEGKEIFGDAIQLKGNSKKTTYKNFIDIFFSKTDAMSVILNDVMFTQQSITIYPEWEKESYAYKKSKTSTPFAFWVNEKEVNSTINYYKTDKSNKTIATTFGFLNEKELPIQTHLYYEYDGSDEYGICYKLISITTKN